MSKPVSVEDLEYGPGVLARIIDTQGDAVWPLFERLERELADVQSRRDRVARYLPTTLNGVDDFG
ncbi:hypothetical protein [Litorimonas haliclonae]|uniref:hypothetical protein n=1 Tax=Litorimonas haliclonae TaxID=2081977 RepID=UPI0039F06FA8